VPPSATELLVNEAVRRLEAQRATLADAASAAGTVLTAAIIGSSFLAGIALRDQSQMPGVGWVGIAFLVVAVLASLAAIMIVGLRGPGMSVMLTGISLDTIDTDEAAQALLESLSSAESFNRTRVLRAWASVQIGIVAAAVSVITWTMLIGRS
jgi:hypothetical protein